MNNRNPNEFMETDLLNPDAHPVYISICDNEKMNTFDLSVSVGNFKSKHEALRFADEIKAFLEDHGDAQFMARA